MKIWEIIATRNGMVINNRRFKLKKPSKFELDQQRFAWSLLKTDKLWTIQVDVEDN
jgi:hypothetical protein